jgi:hypothetical protein
VLEFRFKEKLDEAVADGSTLNLHGSHCEFVEKLMANTGDAQLIPTAKDKKNSATTTPHPIIAINNFPTSNRLHKLCFNRTIYYDKYNKRTVVRIFHAVLMKEMVFAVKQKIFDWLSQKNLWMLAGELDSVETSGIGWMLGAHPFLVFTPDIANRMNFLISRLPPTLIEQKSCPAWVCGGLGKIAIVICQSKGPRFWCNTRQSCDQGRHNYLRYQPLPAYERLDLVHSKA